MKRRRSLQVQIGGLRYGGDAPIVVEAMAKRAYDEIKEEIEALAAEGAELVRIAVNTKGEAERFLTLQEECSVALMADVHFSWRLACWLVDGGAKAVRINPGNMALEGRGFERFAALAAERKTVVRIGSNSGSCNVAGMGFRRRVRRLADVVLEAAEKLEERGVTALILGAKSSDIEETIAANRRIARSTAHPLHIGITATGAGEEALCRSAIAVGTLLMRGIGDGVRVSLCEASVKEVRAVKAILSAVGARRFGARVIACPTCTRCRVDLAEKVAEVKAALDEAGQKDITVAVMGCVVNGPQEAADADFGVAFSGRSAVVFAKGVVVRRVPAKDGIETLLEVIRGAGRQHLLQLHPTGEGAKTVPRLPPSERNRTRRRRG